MKKLEPRLIPTIPGASTAGIELEIREIQDGPLMVSDDLNSLQADNRVLLEEIFQLSEAVRSESRKYFSPDFMEQRMPELQVALGERDAFLGVYNFSSRPKTHRIDLSGFIPWSDYTISEYGRGKSYSAASLDRLETDEIERHGSRVYYLQVEGA